DHLRERLETAGVNVERAMALGRYRSMDPRDLLAGFMLDGKPDPERFTEMATALVAELGCVAGAAGPRVVLCGECAPALLADGDVESALEVERLWDKFAGDYRIATLCGYLTTDDRPISENVVRGLCAGHAAIHWR